MSIWWHNFLLGGKSYLRVLFFDACRLLEVNILLMLSQKSLASPLLLLSYLLLTIVISNLVSLNAVNNPLASYLIIL